MILRQRVRSVKLNISFDSIRKLVIGTGPIIRWKLIFLNYLNGLGMEFHTKLFRIDMNNISRKNGLHEWKNHHLWLIFSCKLFFFYKKKIETDQISAKEYEMGKESEIISMYGGLVLGSKMEIFISTVIHSRSRRLTWNSYWENCAYVSISLVCILLVFFIRLNRWLEHIPISWSAVCGGFRNAAYNRK